MSPVIQSLMQELKEQKERLNAQEKTINTLVIHQDIQATALQQKDKVITTLQNDIEALKAEAERNDATTAELNAEVKELMSEIRSIKQRDVVLKDGKMNENKQFKATLADLQKEVSELTKYVSKDLEKSDKTAANTTLTRHHSVTDETGGQIHLKNHHLLLRNVQAVRATDGQVAFHARCEGVSISHLGSDQTIVFETELLDLGGGYHSATGIFTAPKPGLYLFSVSICSWYNDKSEFNAVLVKNGVWAAAIIGHGGGNVHELDQGSVTVVLQLSTSDDVWVKNAHVNDATIAGWGYTTFTGILIKDM